MKRTLTTDFNPTFLHLWLLFLRIGTACFMLTHGIPKFVDLMAGGQIEFADPIGVGPKISLILTVFAEVVCSTFIFIGLGTRLATIPLMATMLVAAFLIHSGSPFGDKEMALLYMFSYITLLILGSGKYSIDYLLAQRVNTKR